MKTLANIKKNRGLSLIELMIAMVIGVMLLGATATMFISNKRIYKEQDEMGRLQENARFALQLLIEDIRMAGYAGCADDMQSTKNQLNNGGNQAEIFNFSYAVEGLNNRASGSAWKPSDSTASVSNIVAGTDAFAIRYLDPTGIKLFSPMPSASADLGVTVVDGLMAGDIIAIADCSSADIMQATQVQDAGYLQHNTGNNNPGNQSNALQKKYDTGAEVLRLVSRRYYIGTNTHGNSALYRFHRAQDKGDVNNNNNSTEILEHSQELIEGVENMQILYGVDTTGDDAMADAYLDANNLTAANWPNVVSMRLALLFSTVEENTGNDIDTKVYDLLGTSVGPANDKRRRRVVTATIQIRNRSPASI